MTFAFEKDVERRNVFKLLGHGMYVDGSYDKNEPGIETPVRLEIERLDGQEAHAEDVWEFENMAPVDSVELPREHYRIHSYFHTLPKRQKRKRHRRVRRRVRIRIGCRCGGSTFDRGQS